MLDVIQTIILDFQEASIEEGVLRTTKIYPMHGKATVCIGVRRSGKSTYLFQIMQQLLNKSVSKKNILYVNFFDDRLHFLQQEGLNCITEAYYTLYPEKKNTETVYCFFDEIQTIPNWESFVERLLRTEKCEIYITGSSAHMLSKEIATEMRGRALSWELFPFSFQEFLQYKGLQYSPPFSTKMRLLIQKAFDEYLERGGFPEVRDVEKHLRIKIHQEYFQAILFRDLVERHDISHPKALKDLAYLLADNISSLYSINKLTGYLQSIGHSISKSTLSLYLAWFEEAYFFFTVKIFDASQKRSNANPKKMYCIDHSLISSISSGILINSGHMLENIVFIALRREQLAIFYYKTQSGHEVDFLIQTNNRCRMLIQVCESISQEKIRQRELTSLQEAMKELNLSSAIIVTKNEEEKIILSEGSIAVTPIWRFLLDGIDSFHENR